jgi:hypothetical protein
MRFHQTGDITRLSPPMRIDYTESSTFGFLTRKMTICTGVITVSAHKNGGEHVPSNFPVFDQGELPDLGFWQVLPPYECYHQHLKASLRKGVLEAHESFSGRVPKQLQVREETLDAARGAWLSAGEPEVAARPVWHHPKLTTQRCGFRPDWLVAEGAAKKRKREENNLQKVRDKNWKKYCTRRRSKYWN